MQPLRPLRTLVEAPDCTELAVTSRRLGDDVQVHFGIGPPDREWVVLARFHKPEAEGLAAALARPPKRLAETTVAYGPVTLTFKAGKETAVSIHFVSRDGRAVLELDADEIAMLADMLVQATRLARGRVDPFCSVLRLRAAGQVEVYRE